MSRNLKSHRLTNRKAVFPSKNGPNVTHFLCLHTLNLVALIKFLFNTVRVMTKEFKLFFVIQQRIQFVHHVIINEVM